MAKQLLGWLIAVALLAAAAAPSAMAQSTPTITFSASHDAWVMGIGFAPHGRWFASWGSDGRIKLWETSTGRLLKTLGASSGQINSAAISGDAATLVSMDRLGEIKVWDVADAKVMKSFRSPDKEAGTLAVTRDGKSMFVVSERKGTVRRFTLASGAADTVFQVADADTFGASLQLVADESRLVLGYATFQNSKNRSYLAVIDVASGRQVLKIEGVHKNGGSFAVSPDGRWIAAAGGEDQGIKVYDAVTGRLVRTISSGPHRHVAFTPQGQLIAVYGVEYAQKAIPLRIRLFDIQTATLVREFPIGPKVHYVAASHDGRFIASGQGEGGVALWATDTGQSVFIQTTNRDRWSASRMVSDHEWSVVGTSGTSQWSLITGQLEQAKQWTGRFNEVEIAASTTSQVAVVDAYGTLKRLDGLTGQPGQAYSGPKSTVTGFQISPDGKWMAAQYLDSGEPIPVWDVEKAVLVRSLQPAKKDGKTIAISMSADSRLIGAAGYFERLGAGVRLAIWELASGKLVQTIPEGPPSALAFAPDGSLIATVNYDDIKLWDVRTGRAVRNIENPRTGRASKLFFSPGGETIVMIGATFAGSRDIPLVETATGRIVRWLRGNVGSPDNVLFGMGGRRIVLHNGNGSSTVWDAATGDLLTTTLYAPSGEWVTITPEGFFTASENGAKLLHVVNGFETTAIDQVYQSLYRPDLVREKLAGDTRGLVREAAAKLDLNKVLASGNAPLVTLASPRDGTRATAEQVTAEVEIGERGGGIGRVEWRINGVTVGIETPPAPAAGQPVRLSRGLVLDDGENEIEVVAYNGANLVASVPARASVTGQAATARTPARLFVLAIGLNDYAEEKFKLRYAVPDAKALTQALSEAGKGVYESVDVTLVQDADVQRGKLDAVFAELASKVRSSDVFVFFLGGHGKTIDGRYYFIPQDFRVDGGVTKAALEAAVVKQGIAQEEWQAWLARIPARKSVLLFDTCESGSLTGEGKETRALERTAANDRLVQATGRTILTASSDDTDAFEGFRGHGLFTYNVLEALERADTDGNGRIEVAELAAYVYAQVTALSEQVYKQRQVPQVRITGNYSLAKPTQIFAGKEPGIVLPAKATHQVTAAAELLVLPAMGARRVRKLDAKTPVTLVKSDSGWTLVAREGRPLGFVATKDLAPIQ